MKIYNQTFPFFFLYEANKVIQRETATTVERNKLNFEAWRHHLGSGRVCIQTSSSKRQKDRGLKTTILNSDCTALHLASIYQVSHESNLKLQLIN